MLPSLSSDIVAPPDRPWLFYVARQIVGLTFSFQLHTTQLRCSLPSVRDVLNERQRRLTEVKSCDTQCHCGVTALFKR